MNNEYTPFWNAFRHLCGLKGVSPSKACRDMHISSASPTYWSNGTQPSSETLKKITTYFNISPNFFSELNGWRYSNNLDMRNYFQDHWQDLVDEEYYDCNPDEKKSKKTPATRNAGVKVPVLGRVAAGIPIEQIVDVDDYEDISEAMAANGDYFALKIHGDSMQPRMCENDVIIVRKQEMVENGETAVVSINGLDATCKKIEYTDDGITLISTNPAYSPMHFTQKQINDLPIRILGKVVEIRCKL